MNTPYLLIALQSDVLMNDKDLAEHSAIECFYVRRPCPWRCEQRLRIAQKAVRRFIHGPIHLRHFGLVHAWQDVSCVVY